MEQDLLNSYEEKGLTCPFVAAKTGDVVIAQSGGSVKDEIAQVATVIFETIGAIGDIKIDKIEIMGEAKGLILELDQDSLFGSLFEQHEDLVLNDLWSLLGELKTQPAVVTQVEVKEKPREVPREKPRVKMETSVLDAMKEMMKDYLGDFTERIYKNQLKSQRIKVDDFFDEDARRLIFALGKAAVMIIGPSKGREMTNKLLNLLK